MNDLIKKFCKDSLTTSTGVDYDIGRILWLLFSLAGIGYAGFDLLYLHNKFDIVQYGIGAGGLLSLGGLALKLKQDTEAK
jgi:hypothetical protein